MELTDEKKKEYTRRLLMSRFRILTDHGFYGLLLMHINFGLDDTCDTAYTDGNRICFSPEFMDHLSDSELDFVLMHEILHVVLKHCYRTADRDPLIFNEACDIVVNSTILKSNNMDLNSITVRDYGVSMHETPDGKEGYDFTAEQVYENILAAGGQKCSGSKPGTIVIGQAGNGKNSSNSGSGNCKGKGTGSGNWDDHSKWQDITDLDDEQDAIWNKHLRDACEAVSVRDPSNSRGTIPGCALRVFKELTEAQTDWRTVLQDFVQEEVVDYSFNPPDRRFDDSPFYLPDFNDAEQSVKDILFMIDTSGSMSDDMITAAYSEIKGAIDQFNGKLKGWLGFFDARVVPPVPFEDEDEFRVIRPKGGGGTSFSVIFRYISRHMEGHLPATIIILTDGYTPFPEESAACGIPVLWVINNTEVDPPWGKVARIEVAG